MSLSPETKRGELPVEERPEEFPETLRIEDKSVPLTSSIPTQVKPVYDDNGQPITQTPQTQQITIKIPKGKEELTTLSKGSVGNAPTWDAAYWLRQIAKAILWGWRWIVGGKENVTA